MGKVLYAYSANWNNGKKEITLTASIEVSRPIKSPLEFVAVVEKIKDGLGAGDNFALLFFSKIN